jgi:hypothetical protein
MLFGFVRYKGINNELILLQEIIGISNYYTK